VRRLDRAGRDDVTAHHELFESSKGLGSVLRDQMKEDLRNPRAANVKRLGLDGWLELSL